MTQRAATLKLRPGRERSLLRRHPWVFSGSVESLEGEAAVGDTVRVVASDGRFLAWAAYSPSSRLRARVWSFDPTAVIGPDFFRSRLIEARELRDALFAERPDALRLVHGESDGLPGLVIDRYGEQLVLAATAAGAHARVEELAGLAQEVFGAEAVYERSAGDVLKLEGLPARSRDVIGEAPAEPIAFAEHGVRFAVEVRTGHKTGFYLDQRDNRQRVRALSRDREVLDCFCYTGGFSLAAAAGGARSVTAIDSSEPALERARAQARDNGHGDAIEFRRQDVFQMLRAARDAGTRYDLIVLDPPKLAPTVKHAERASRAYKDINLLAFKLLRPGGLLFTFSCSAGIGRELFAKIVAGAAVDAGVDARVCGRLSSGVDHPVSIHFPEGDYLKGLLLARS